MNSNARQRQALRDAAQWYARLGAAPHCNDTRQRWSAWQQQDAVHQWAWQRLEALHAQMQGLPAPLTRETLLQGGIGTGRRAVLKGLMIGLGVAGTGWAGYREAPVWLADLRTGTGERRSLSLDDGTRLTLNTASAVDIRYDAGQRLIVLRAGEILVETAKDSRPLSVRSAQGTMRALGTRFGVRQYAGHTELSVLEHDVAVSNGFDRHERIVHAGQRLGFDNSPLAESQPLEANPMAWRNGRLVIDNWRLDRVLDELQRYRPGVIQCASEVAGLRLSGAFPLDDTNQTLLAIAEVLPVRVQTHTRFWVRVLPNA
ncbi:fec operon regulator FecR [Pseudomonas sp. 3A(2025)]